MSKIAEERAWDWSVENKVDPYSMGQAYAIGYEQAEQDTIEKAVKWLSERGWTSATQISMFKKAMEEEK